MIDRAIAGLGTALALLLAPGLTAQGTAVVYGTVRDSATGSALQGVQVASSAGSAGVVSRQPSKASAAAIMARSTSAGPETGDEANTSPVLGSTRSAYPPSAGSR